MPKWLIIIIAVVLGGCALCGGIVCFGFGKYGEMSKEAATAADRIVVPFMTTWDAKSLADVATQDLLRITPMEKLQVEAEAWKSKFGAYKSNSGWKMTAVYRKSATGSETYIDSTLSTTGTFEKGTANINLILRKTGEQYRVHSLAIQ